MCSRSWGGYSRKVETKTVQSMSGLTLKDKLTGIYQHKEEFKQKNRKRELIWYR